MGGHIMAGIYYRDDDGRKIGPVQPGELIRLAADNEIGRDTEVKVDGEWFLAEDIDYLSLVLPPPKPTLSERLGELFVGSMISLWYLLGFAASVCFIATICAFLIFWKVRTGFTLLFAACWLNAWALTCSQAVTAKFSDDPREGTKAVVCFFTGLAFAAIAAIIKFG